MMKAMRLFVSGVVFALLTGAAQAAEPRKVDVLLIGGGIMSATLGVMLQELEPDWSMVMMERLDGVAQESSNGWNNAGTGHSALAELNYTPERPDGSIDIAKAIDINEDFQVSRQFWAHQVKAGVLKNPRSFINSTPHMSFVWGESNIRFLKKRHEALKASPLFQGMQYSEDPAQIRQWVPLMMEGRDPQQKVAATWSSLGTDVNFGEITRQFVGHLQSRPNFDLQLSTEVQGLKRNSDGSWRVSYKNLKTGQGKQEVDAKFVFVGAGGGVLPLLQASGIPEAKEYGAFPVGGAFLVTEKPEIAGRHLAKAYGKAAVGSPPMSVPHLDTRMLDGKKVLLFGPFATFSTKFLKDGSYFDLPLSATFSNVMPMLHVAVDEFALVQYLGGQLIQSDDARHEALKEYFPAAKKEDWRLIQAGQRVQIIKRDKEKGGVLRLGTEIVSAQDGSIAGLLGASPGASTAAPIMLNLLYRVFKDRAATAAWQSRIRQIVPSHGVKLNNAPDRLQEELRLTSEILQLMPPPDAEPRPAGPGAQGENKSPIPKPQTTPSEMAL